LSLPNNFRIEKLMIDDCKPASFYILPKVHKEYTIFPPGRPISSTLKVINRNISGLLDFILKPIMNYIPNLILDTTHFLILLKHLKLNIEHKYSLITFDVDNMYTNLDVKSCKYHCCNEFENHKNTLSLPFNISGKQLQQLMSLSFDFSHLKYENQYFYQKKGIQMGNAASVSTANITAHNELKSLFENKPEIEFYARFIDDGFLIVNSNNIDNMTEWCTNTFKHKFLSFTYNLSETEVNFLDINVKLSTDNIITTSLYKKPMSKHAYLHYYSNHPKHLMNSLPYSQGLRIIRICSENTTRELEIKKLVNSFKGRGYPDEILNRCLDRLKPIDRNDLLKPTKHLIVSNLRIHNPQILSQYVVEYNPSPLIPHNKIYIVMPFYKNVWKLNSLVTDLLEEELKKCQNSNVKTIVSNLDINIAYKKTNSLEMFCKPKNQK
jgi:hypothetical protein